MQKLLPEVTGVWKRKNKEALGQCKLQMKGLAETLTGHSQINSTCLPFHSEILSLSRLAMPEQKLMLGGNKPILLSVTLNYLIWSSRIQNFMEQNQVPVKANLTNYMKGINSRLMNVNSIKLEKSFQPPLLSYKNLMIAFLSHAEKGEYDSYHWEKNIGTVKLDKMLTIFLGTQIRIAKKIIHSFEIKVFKTLKL